MAPAIDGEMLPGIDAVGEVIAIEARPRSWELQLRWLEPHFGRYICDKASVAVDGISLTVARCDDDGVVFTLAVIPHTWAATTLQHRAVGDQVNLEADQLARYAERLLVDRTGAMSDNRSAQPSLSREWLSAHGWS